VIGRGAERVKRDEEKKRRKEEGKGNKKRRREKELGKEGRMRPPLGGRKEAAKIDSGLGCACKGQLARVGRVLRVGSSGRVAGVGLIRA
jgi:hypothetical protein